MRNHSPAPDGMVLIAEIGAASGIKGEVRIKLYSDDPAALTAYGDLQDAAGTSYRVIRSRPVKSVFVCALDGINDRASAEALTRTQLYIHREKLPEPDPDEFYHIDLIGLDVRQADGETLGTVLAMHDFGAGDILEIATPDDDSRMIPFSLAAVPVVDVAGGFVQLADLPGLLDEPDPDDPDKEL
tara:strand:- start:6134 stop:6688 length:555 start_codon:yes stop_codon:yes gene_type:complete